jgi:hypothetical protein
MAIGYGIKSYSWSLSAIYCFGNEISEYQCYFEKKHDSHDDAAENVILLGILTKVRCIITIEKCDIIRPGNGVSPDIN